MWLKHYKLNEEEQKLVDMSREEFNSYMMEHYSDLFKNRYAQEGQKVIYPMNFGFEIGQGWRHVLDSLCRKLKAIQDLTGVVCVFDQIKEKFGSARFYYHIESLESSKENVSGFSNEDILDDACGIIDVLVNHYEEYTEYVCEELGTNVHSGEKIQMGSWMYGMGIEGFEKWERESHPESCEDRIRMAKEYLERVGKLKEIKDKMYYLSMDELERIDKIVNEIQEERKARNDAV